MYIEFDAENGEGYTFVRLVLDVVGRAYIANSLGLTRGAVQFWYVNSKVPADHKNAVCGMARERGLLIKPEDL